VFNILYVDNFGEIIGGGQRSLLGLLEGLDKTEFKPIVVCPVEGSLSQEVKKLNIGTRIVNMPSLRQLNLIGLCKGVSQLKKIIKDEKINLVHANGSRAAIYAGLASKLTGIRLVWHVRIVDSDGLLDRFLASLSTRIIVVSEAVNRRFIWMQNRRDGVKTIYNGIDLERFSPVLSGEGIRREFGLDSDTPLVGTVGRLDWYKGHDYFLMAARKVIDKFPNCHFMIVGEGQKRKELEDLTKKLNLKNNITFTGDRKDIAEILASFDLFVLSSVSEGLGRSVIEAMAMRKAVVATNVGGIPEVVRDRESGIVVPAKNVGALAEAIIDLVENNDKTLEMGLSGRRIVKEKFDIKANVEKTQELYKDILK